MQGRSLPGKMCVKYPRHSYDQLAIDQLFYRSVEIFDEKLSNVSHKITKHVKFCPQSNRKLSLKRKYFGTFENSAVFLSVLYSPASVNCNETTVELVLSGTALSGHPLLSGQLSKSRKLCPLTIKPSPLLIKRPRSLLSPNELFLLS